MHDDNLRPRQFDQRRIGENPEANQKAAEGPCCGGLVGSVSLGPRGILEMKAKALRAQANDLDALALALPSSGGWTPAAENALCRILAESMLR